MSKQASEDITEILEAARAGGRKLANRTYAAIVQARTLTTTEAVMLSGHAQNAIRKAGIVLWKS